MAARSPVRVPGSGRASRMHALWGASLSVLPVLKDHGTDPSGSHEKHMQDEEVIQDS